MRPDESGTRSSSSTRLRTFTRMTAAFPTDVRSVTPRIIVDDVPQARRLPQRMYSGRQAEVLEDRPAVIRIGDSLVMISETGPRDRVTVHSACRTCLMSDATLSAGHAGGAASIEATPNTTHGDRRAMVKDPCAQHPGNLPHMPLESRGVRCAECEP